MNDLTFYIDKFIFTLKTQEPDLSFVPSNLRRRFNSEDKHTVFSINHCMRENVKEIVFASQYGCFDRLIKLTEQYKEMKEVSPTLFSTSVHNTSVGQYTLLTKKTIPSIAISGGDETFIQGLITAITTKKTVVYCFSDFFGEIKTIAFSISSTPTKNKYILRKNDRVNGSNDLKEVIDLFSGKIKKAESGGYEIEAINDD